MRHKFFVHNLQQVKKYWEDVRSKKIGKVPFIPESSEYNQLLRREDEFPLVSNVSVG
jgi:hypothetical protein